jgi:hypothetical protein
MDADVEAVAASTTYTAESDVGGATQIDGDGAVLDGNGDAYTAASFTQTAAVAAVHNPTSYSLGYTMGNVAFAMAGTEHNDAGDAAAKMSLTYTMSDALSVKYGIDNAGSLKDVSELSATAKISDMLSITASIKDDKDHAGNTNEGGKQSQNASIAYSAGSLKGVSKFVYHGGRYILPLKNEFSILLYNPQISLPFLRITKGTDLPTGVPATTLGSSFILPISISLNLRITSPVFTPAFSAGPPSVADDTRAPLADFMPKLSAIS